MKKNLLAYFGSFCILLFTSSGFSQVTVAVQCRLSPSYYISANFDSVKNTLQVVRIVNGEEADFQGISFTQLNRQELNKNSSLVRLAAATGIQLAQANSVNVFLLQQSDDVITQLVDFINVDAQSIGVAAVVGPQTKKCE